MPDKSAEVGSNQSYLSKNLAKFWWTSAIFCEISQLINGYQHLLNIPVIGGCKKGNKIKM